MASEILITEPLLELSLGHKPQRPFLRILPPLEPSTDSSTNQQEEIPWQTLTSQYCHPRV